MNNLPTVMLMNMSIESATFPQKVTSFLALSNYIKVGFILTLPVLLFTLIALYLVFVI